LLKRDLAREISTWVEKDLISVEQATSICRVYGIDYDSIRNYSAGYRILISLGYLFIGLSVIILLSANWDEIPRGLRMAGLLAITFATHGWALKLYFETRDSDAIGLFFLGNIFFGASIILIAQIYHLGEHMPDGVFWWAFGTLPVGLLLENSRLTLFSCLLALIWFFLEYSLGFSATLFPVFIAAAVYILIKGPSSTLLFLTAVASFGLWVEAWLSAVWSGSRHGLNWHAEHFFVSCALFVFAYAASKWLGTRNLSKAQDYGALLSLWALRFGLIIMLAMSFAEPWEALIQSHMVHANSMWQLVIVLLGASLWLGWKTESLPTLLPISGFFLLEMIVVVLSDNRDLGLVLQVITNVATVSAAVWLILRGIERGVSHYFFLGVATILLIALMRYFDLIGEYIGGAALFMVLAILLLGAAKYWRRQQTVGAES
jgi:uncharacterized membrane protein